MLTAFSRVAGLARSAWLTVARPRASHRYVTSAPSPQQALDIFKGEWASRLPAPFDGCDAGTVPLFGDPRLL
jgi:hypothetical protein